MDTTTTSIKNTLSPVGYLPLRIYIYIYNMCVCYAKMTRIPLRFQYKFECNLQILFQLTAQWCIK